MTEDDLSAFLNAFYARVRRDELLAPVFAHRIAEDDWPRHIATIRDFWSSVLFRTRRYTGNPFAKHRGLEGLSVQHFERWLALFGETAQAFFEPAVAQALTERANRIGDSLQAGLFFRPERGNACPA